VIGAIDHNKDPNEFAKIDPNLQIPMVKKLFLMEAAIAVIIAAVTYWVTRRNEREGTQRSALYPLALFLGLNNAVDAFGYGLMIEGVSAGGGCCC
jgi:hypothetical protein